MFANRHQRDTCLFSSSRCLVRKRQSQVGAKWPHLMDGTVLFKLDYQMLRGIPLDGREGSTYSAVGTEGEGKGEHNKLLRKSHIGHQVNLVCPSCLDVRSNRHIFR